MNTKELKTFLKEYCDNIEGYVDLRVAIVDWANENLIGETEDELDLHISEQESEARNVRNTKRDQERAVVNELLSQDDL